MCLSDDVPGINRYIFLNVRIVLAGTMSGKRQLTQSAGATSRSGFSPILRRAPGALGSNGSVTAVAPPEVQLGGEEGVNEGVGDEGARSEGGGSEGDEVGFEPQEGLLGELAKDPSPVPMATVFGAPRQQLQSGR